MIAFAKPGPENTDRALEVAFQTAMDRGIQYVVIASTWGDTARRALRLMGDSGLNLVVVTHNTGFKRPGEQEFDAGLRRELEAHGVKVLTSTMPTRGINRAIRDRYGYSEIDVINSTLRIFSEGVKVCAEIACMACDAGLIPPEDVVCVAGTGRGADTVVVLKAQPSNKFFDLRIREIVAKPYDF